MTVSSAASPAWPSHRRLLSMGIPRGQPFSRSQQPRAKKRGRESVDCVCIAVPGSRHSTSPWFHFRRLACSQHNIVVGETVILLHPPSTFCRCFNCDGERESVSKMTVSPTAAAHVLHLGRHRLRHLQRRPGMRQRLPGLPVHAATAGR